MAPRIWVARGRLCLDCGALWGRAQPNKDLASVQRSAISETKREDICKHRIDVKGLLLCSHLRIIWMEDHEVDLQQAIRANILILDVTSLKKEEEANVKKKYCLANPISFDGPTEADIHMNANFEKLLMESEVYESAEESQEGRYSSLHRT
nr:nuclear poly(A) polymerase 4-like [Tanacetum cinerariifolium]